MAPSIFGMSRKLCSSDKGVRVKSDLKILTPAGRAQANSSTNSSAVRPSMPRLAGVRSASPV